MGKKNVGFAIGGVPPIGHLTPLRTYIDEDLQNYDIIWAAAGAPHAVFSLTPTKLEQLTKGTILELAEA